MADAVKVQSKAASRTQRRASRWLTPPNWPARIGRGNHAAGVLRGQYAGTIGDIACFSEIRFVDFDDRRRTRDIDADYINGPATVEMLTPQGKVIGRIGLATRADVAAHPSGKVAH